MGIIDKLGGSLVNGAMGNMSEVSLDNLIKEYGDYIMADEEIKTGFKLIRDVMIITDKRLIEFDKQGATGQKMRVKSIYLESIVDVTVETAGFGVDDSELTITYITSPYYKVSGGASVSDKTFEFPKSFDVVGLYRLLQEIAYKNHIKING
ncbi:MAG: PH domain-containing protein [Tyzzerella sp.]|uniref:PH domain-containing protein n=1 Tax=Candidatus Fimicola merdigallinarum TaxID=2840819 RepID=A0A9D9DXZ0_9FIRM|nr:PH domain-containing protein [Candidatus Fimicola merdigallinarum]